MSISPVVRYMLLCDDWGINARYEDRIDALGLLVEIFPESEPAYPFTLSGLCIILILAEVRGIGRGHVRCVHLPTDDVVFQTTEFDLQGTASPLDVIGIPLRIDECEFPHAGAYAIQFWYNEQMVEERAFHLRALS